MFQKRVTKRVKKQAAVQVKSEPQLDIYGIINIRVRRIEN